MDKNQIVVVGRDDLMDFVQTMFMAKLSERLLDSKAAAQVLGISVSTLNRWIDKNLIHPDNANEGHRVERKFSLSYLLNIDVQEIKKKYRALNQ